MYRTIVITVMVSALVSTSALAANTPHKLSTTQHIEAVNFVPDDIVPIYGKPFYTTLITFGEDEIIQSVSSGDMAAWMSSSINGKPNLLLLKPTAEHSNTNMTVVTNQHTYFFTLHALAKDAKQVPTYAVKFKYPQKIAAQLKARNDYKAKQAAALLSAPTHPQGYNWHYSFNGDKSIMPIHVFDDGTFTYFEFNEHTPQPALFAVDNRQGAEAVVNVRRKGRYVIAQRIAPQFTLREGRYHVASIFNQSAISKLNS